MKKEEIGINNPEAFKVDALLENGEKKEIFIKTWHDHVRNRDEIVSAATIVKDELFFFQAKEGQMLIPFSEYHGDHDVCWIILIDIKTNEEIYRKNVRFLDMVNWKLSSSPTNLKANGK